MPHISFAPWHNSVSVLAELPLRTTTRSLVVCVCVVNLMIVSETPGQQTSLWHITPSWSHSNAWDYRQGSDLTRWWWRAVCSSAAGTTERREVHFSSGTLTLKMCLHLFLFHSGSRGSRLWRESHVCTETSWHLASTTRENKTTV